MASYQYVYHMDGVSKTYPGGKKTFENIRLNFLPGVKIGVVGVNGAGKSTLLRIMAGIDKEWNGEGFVAQGARVGYLPQARFVYIIRHPVDRAISQLKMNLSRKNRRPGSAEAWMAEIDDPVLYDRGDYASYVPRWQARFGPDRLMILPFGRIAADPVGVLRDIEAFCGLDPHHYRNADTKVFAAASGLSVPEPARLALRARLEPQFAFLDATFGPAFTAQMR